MLDCQDLRRSSLALALLVLLVDPFGRGGPVGRRSRLGVDLSLSGLGGLRALVCKIEELGCASDYPGGLLLDHFMVFDPSLECYDHRLSRDPWNGVLAFGETLYEVSQRLSLSLPNLI